MRFFLTLSLILPSVLAAPFKFPTHHQHSPSYVITGVAYPNPRHALVLLGKREPDPPTGDSVPAFLEFLLLDSIFFPCLCCSLSSIRQRMTACLAQPLQETLLQHPVTIMLALPLLLVLRQLLQLPLHLPHLSKTHGSTTAGLTSTGTLAGSDSDAHGTSANTAGNPFSGNAAFFADSEITLTQSDPSAFDTPIPQDMTAGFSSPVMDNSVSDSFGDVSGSMGDPFDSLDDAPVNSDTEEGEPVAMDAKGGV
ncbi:hypothetical protein C8R48DRAFT_768222 [Suillus tomentosus]|nr:hypothetical protein C8R48DRAFT_768222 [Suillus tomentosus]